MAVRSVNPFSDNISGPVSGGGSGVLMPSPYPRSALAEAGQGIGNMLGEATRMALYDPKNDPNAAKAAYNNQKTHDLQQLQAGRELLSQMVTNPAAYGIDLSSPKAVAASYPKMLAAAFKNGIEPKTIGQIISGVTAMGGGSEEQIRRGQVAAGEQPKFGKDQAILPSFQQGLIAQDQTNTMAKEKFVQGAETGRNAATNATSASNNAATNATNLTIHKTSPINTPAGTTSTGAPGDPRFPNGPIIGSPTDSTAKGALIAAGAAGTATPAQQSMADILLGKQPKTPPSLNPVYKSGNVMDPIADAITNHVGPKAQVDPALMQALRPRVSQLYDDPKSPLHGDIAGATAQAVKELAQPGTKSSYFGMGPDVQTYGMKPPGGAPAAPTPAPDIPPPPPGAEGAPAGAPKPGMVLKFDAQGNLVQPDQT